MADTHEMPTAGGSFTRDPKTGKLRVREAPTRQKPGGGTPAPAAEPEQES